MRPATFARNFAESMHHCKARPVHQGKTASSEARPAENRFHHLVIAKSARRTFAYRWTADFLIAALRTGSERGANVGLGRQVGLEQAIVGILGTLN
jgi:hypothetical protein